MVSIKKIAGIIVVVIAIGIIATNVINSMQTEQVKQFVAKCHAEGGVVVEEFQSNDLLCFPTDA